MHPEVEHLIEAWHWMYFEADLVFGGLQEDNLHRRPAPGLLAVSEHAAHLARSEASIVNRYLFGQLPELPLAPMNGGERGLGGEGSSGWADCLFRRAEFGWPPTMLEGPVNPDLAKLSVAEVFEQLTVQHLRCYELARTLALSPDHEFDDDWPRIRTVRDRLRIAAYHVAYHMGQIYSVRHLLGEETPEN